MTIDVLREEAQKLVFQFPRGLTIRKGYRVPSRIEIIFQFPRGLTRDGVEPFG